MSPMVTDLIWQSFLPGKLLRSSIEQWLELHARFRARLPELKSQLSHPGGSIRIPFS